MKTTTKLCFFIAVLCLLAGCSSEDIESIGDARVAVQFGSQIGKQQTRTTADGAEWSSGDKIGIYMLKSEETLSDANIINYAKNVPYKANNQSATTSGFAPVHQVPIYYPQNGNVDFVAYYPYKPTGSNAGEIDNYIYPVDLSDQTKPEDIDILYSKNAIAKNKNSSTVSLEFYHALSKITIKLKSNNGLGSLQGAKIELTDCATIGTIDLRNGETFVTSARQTLTVNPNSNSIILLPQQHMGQFVITLANGGNIFKYELNPSTVFEKGKSYTYNIKINILHRISKTDISVSTGDIIDWEVIGNGPTIGDAE